MQLDIEGKTALITGSSRGIGHAVARAFHREGCNVMLNARSEESLRHAADALGERAAYFACDVTAPQACAAMVKATLKKWRAIDVLVCNVGSGASVGPGQENHAEWQRMLSLNLASCTNTVEAARAALIASRGAIVCISSICGVETVPGAPVIYAAAKAALNAYVRGVARPLGKRGVRINAIAPGNIVFEGSVWADKLAADPAGVEAMLKREVALGRLGRPEEIADLALFLASPRAAFITGSVYVVDGGQVRS